mgnify:CR=1 FL=1
MNRRNRELLASPYFIWSVGFTVIPLIVILRYAFTNAAGAFTFENILAIGDSINRKAFQFSLEIALICTLLCILLALLIFASPLGGEKDVPLEESPVLPFATLEEIFPEAQIVTDEE